MYNYVNAVSIFAPLATILLEVLQFLIDLAKEFLTVLGLIACFFDLSFIVSKDFVDFRLYCLLSLFFLLLSQLTMSRFLDLLVFGSFNFKL